MKYALFIVLSSLVISCNSSADKKTSPGDSSELKEATMDIPVAVTPAVRLSRAQLPPTIKFKGNLEEAWQWNDRNGENILIMSKVPVYADKEKNEYGEEGTSAELHAFHFVKKGEAYQLLWKISDAEKACPFDLSLSFFKNADTATITDLDADGFAETIIQYKKACRSDVSPAYMKVIMHEDTAKYSLRGAMWVFDGGNGKFTVTDKDVNLETLQKEKDEIRRMYQLYGRYETEKEFEKAPPAFLQHARRQWLKHAKESFD